MMLRAALLIAVFAFLSACATTAQPAPRSAVEVVEFGGEGHATFKVWGWPIEVRLRATASGDGPCPVLTLKALGLRIEGTHEDAPAPCIERWGVLLSPRDPEQPDGPEPPPH